MKTVKIALIALSMTLTAGQAISAAIYTLDDNWINGPSFSSTHGDEISTPNVHNMLGTVENNPSDIRQPFACAFECRLFDQRVESRRGQFVASDLLPF